jgi:hypothetical protein
MADKDIFMTSVPRLWRGLSNIIEGESMYDSELIPIIVSNLARSIRKMGGCGYLPTVNLIVANMANDQIQGDLFGVPGQPDIDSALVALNGIERQNGNSPLAKVIVREAKSLLTQFTNNSDEHKSTGDIALALTKNICHALIQHLLFSRIRGKLVQKRFHSFSKERIWEKSLKKNSEPGVRKLAISILRDPTAHHLRSPIKSVKHKTHEILEQVLTAEGVN